MNGLIEPQEKRETLSLPNNLSVGWLPLGGMERSGSRLRCYFPCKSIRSSTIRSEIFRFGIRYDIVIFQRCYSPADRSLASSLKRENCKTILDLCDNDFHNPEGDSTKNTAITGLLEMIDEIDLITVSSLELQRIVSNITDKPVLLVEEYLDTVRSQTYHSISTKISGAIKRIPGRGRTKLVWFGYGQQRNPETGINFLSDILPFLARCNQAFPLSLSVISNHRQKYTETIRGISFPTQYFPWNRRSFSFILRLHDICLIPVQKNSFTICKSQNRLVTALLHNVAVIADEIPSYREYSQYFLSGDWEANLRLYLADTKLRHNHVRDGKRYIQKRHSKETIDRQWLTALQTVLKTGK
jgi:hypothetical protein